MHGQSTNIYMEDSEALVKVQHEPKIYCWHRLNWHKHVNVIHFKKSKISQRDKETATITQTYSLLPLDRCDQA